jgi:hypothetical protein
MARLLDQPSGGRAPSPEQGDVGAYAVLLVVIIGC